MNFNSSQKDKQEGALLDNTGGSVPYVTPTLSTRFTKQSDLTFGYAVPIYKGLNGESGGSGKTAYTEGQGLEGHRLFVRFGVTF